MKGIAAASALAACGSRSRSVRHEPVVVGPRPDDQARAAPPPHAPRPRSLVLVAMRGGFDAVLTTSPKLQDEVDSFVDVPYGPGDLFEARGHRFGPHLRPLEPHLGAFAILNNIQVGTVRHETGDAQLVRLRLAINELVPTATDVIGWYRQGPPLGAVSLGGRNMVGLSAGMLECTTMRFQTEGQHDLCDVLTAMSADELHRGADALDRLATDATPETRRHSQDVAAFMRRLAVVPPFKEEPWIPETDPSERMYWQGPVFGYMARDFQRTLWLLEHELTACVNLGTRGLDWDSHVDNLDWQTRVNPRWFQLVARFMDELQRRRNRHGTLAEQTMIVMGSELGRNPRINDHKGKDHFPESCLFFAGPNIKAGDVYGATGRMMEGQPISPATGKPDPRGVAVDLDDVGATVMTAFGIDPLVHGYTGRLLPFLVDA